MRGNVGISGEEEQHELEEVGTSGLHSAMIAAALDYKTRPPAGVAFASALLLVRLGWSWS